MIPTVLLAAVVVGRWWMLPVCAVAWVAILITIGATAAIPLGLLIIFRLVPILAVSDMLEADPDDIQAEDRAPESGPELGVPGPVGAEAAT